MDLNPLTVYLILGVCCALASWSEDFEKQPDQPLTFWEYVFIIFLGPVFAVFELVALVRQRLRKRND